MLRCIWLALRRRPAGIGHKLRLGLLGLVFWSIFMAYRPPAVALAVVSGGARGGDFGPPVANLLQPVAGGVTDLQQPLILISFSDSGSGVDRGSLRLYLDGNRVFEGEDLKENTLSYLPPFPLAPG